MTEQIAVLTSAVGKILWPTTLVIFLLRYRDAIVSLLGQTRKLKGPGGLEVEFQERTQEVLDELSETRIPLPPAEHNLLTELAQANPRLAINSSWARVRASSARAAAAVGISSQSTVRRIARLKAEGYATEEVVGLAQTLKSVQTTLLTHPDFEPPRDFAEAFALAALSLAQSFDKTADSSYPPSGYPPSGYPPADGPKRSDPSQVNNYPDPTDGGERLDELGDRGDPDPPTHPRT